MASVGFDELVDFLLDKIALSGSKGNDQTSKEKKRVVEKRQHEFDPHILLISFSALFLTSTNDHLTRRIFRKHSAMVPGILLRRSTSTK